MLKRIISGSVRHRTLVLLLSGLFVAAGVWALLTTTVDAIPDLSDVQVIVQTEWMDQAPQVMEDQVTYPLTTALLSVPGARTVRGISAFGISYVYVIFEDGTDPYWARTRVLEYLAQVRDELPPGVSPQLGPDATGVGWIYQYTVESDRHDLAELRSIQDFFLRFRLQSVPGVAEVAALGGYVRQYQVDLDPQRLQGFGVTLEEVTSAIRAANADVGARVLQAGGREYMVRGLGYIGSIEDIESVVVGTGPGGTPILVSDVAFVQLGPDLRRGVADRDGEREVVSGIVVMRHGENALEVIDAVKVRLEELASGLPEGVRIVDAYDRAPLIREAISNLGRTILQVLLITALVSGLFLLHLRSALVVVVTLPVAVLGAFLAMRLLGVPANIMSLAGIAIAIGAMVDAGVVLIDNVHKHLEREDEPVEAARRWSIVADAASEVGPAVFFSLLVVTVSFLPVFALEAQEGRLFHPLAWTKTLAMASAAILSITLVPVMLGLFIRGRLRSEAENPVSRGLLKVYRPLLHSALRFRWVVLGGAVLALGLTILPARDLGSEFMPPIEEGTLLFMPMTLPGISIDEARERMMQQNRIIAGFPEVESVVGKAGRANTATDPSGLDMFETVVNLHPESEWRAGMTLDRLVEEMDVATQLPGISNLWTLPIQNRIDMLTTGMRTPVGVRIFGPDLGELQRLGVEAEAILRQVPGTRSAAAERGVSGAYLDVEVDRAAAARYGLNVAQVQSVLMTAIGGTTVTQTVEGRERYDVAVRYARDFRDSPEAVGNVRVPLPGGGEVTLSTLARIGFSEGPMVIRTEDAFPVTSVFLDVEGRDLGGYVSEAAERLAAELELPTGYTLSWAGQFEAMERVRDRMALILPLTLALVFILLFLHFGSMVKTLMVMLTLPFALVGGIWLLWAMEFETSVAVWVGFIALAGLAVEMGVVMLIYLDQAYAALLERTGGRPGPGEVLTAVTEGASQRLRPVLMTVVSDIAALLPLLWLSGVGAATMHRIAAPLVGGLVTAMILALFVIPAVYSVWREWELGRAEGERI